MKTVKEFCETLKLIEGVNVSVQDEKTREHLDYICQDEGMRMLDDIADMPVLKAFLNGTEILVLVDAGELLEVREFVNKFMLRACLQYDRLQGNKGSLEELIKKASALSSEYMDARNGFIAQDIETIAKRLNDCSDLENKSLSALMRSFKSIKVGKETVTPGRWYTARKNAGSIKAGESVLVEDIRNLWGDIYQICVSKGPYALDPDDFGRIFLDEEVGS